MRDETWDSWRADTLSGSIEQIRERVDAFAALGVDRAGRVARGRFRSRSPEPEQVDLFAEALLGR